MLNNSNTAKFIIVLKQKMIMKNRKTNKLPFDKMIDDCVIFFFVEVMTTQEQAKVMTKKILKETQTNKVNSTHVHAYEHCSDPRAKRSIEYTYVIRLP